MREGDILHDFTQSFINIGMNYMRRMSFLGKGWFFESWRHSLAAKGISTRINFDAIDLPRVFKEPEPEPEKSEEKIEAPMGEGEDFGDLSSEDIAELKKLRMPISKYVLFKKLTEDELEKRRISILTPKGVEVEKVTLSPQYAAVLSSKKEDLVEKMDDMQRTLYLSGSDFERSFFDVEAELKALKGKFLEADYDELAKRMSDLKKLRAIHYDRLLEGGRRKIFEDLTPEKKEIVTIDDLRKLLGAHTRRSAGGERVAYDSEYRKIREKSKRAEEKKIEVELKVAQIKQKEKRREEKQKKLEETKLIAEAKTLAEEKREKTVDELSKEIPGFGEE